MFRDENKVLAILMVAPYTQNNSFEGASIVLEMGDFNHAFYP